MDTTDKRLGEAALRHLCLGTQIVGVRWYAFNFFIEIESVIVRPPVVNMRALLLTVESRWTVFPTAPDRFPDAESDLPEPPLDERAAMLARLAGQEIVAVALGDRHPHLIVTFESGSVFFLNGFHERYECWHLDTVEDLDGFDWTIVAVPGSAIGLFIPPGFAP